MQVGDHVVTPGGRTARVVRVYTRVTVEYDEKDVGRKVFFPNVLRHLSGSRRIGR